MSKKSIQERYNTISKHLDEKGKRLWCATEALALERGVSLVSKATGVSRTTITEGVKELRGEKEIAPSGKVRRIGGGRKMAIKKDTNLMLDIEKLVEPVTRGDPESPLRWTSKSTQKLADELNKDGIHRASDRLVSRILKNQGYSLQVNKKTKEGGDHPDRDAQFNFINEKVKDFQGRNQPAISVDTKKKENIGNFLNNGREYHKKGQAPEVNVYDFVDKEKGKVAPYGVYDLAANKGWVSVGISADTAKFAVNSVRGWWKNMGKKVYPNAKEIYINADGGGSNGSRVRLWKIELQKLANELNLIIHISHFPPGTSKWNKIEHRMFSFISKNWRGKPLIDRATVVNLIGSTTTKTGLKIQAELDENIYEKGIKISDKDFEKIILQKDIFHGEWNYSILPSM